MSRIHPRQRQLQHQRHRHHFHCPQKRNWYPSPTATAACLASNQEVDATSSTKTVAASQTNLVGIRVDAAQNHTRLAPAGKPRQHRRVGAMVVIQMEVTARTASAGYVDYFVGIALARTHSERVPRDVGKGRLGASWRYSHHHQQQSMNQVDQSLIGQVYIITKTKALPVAQDIN